MQSLVLNGNTSIFRIYGDPILYGSPYVVVIPTGCTKHYFVESERFAIRIGEGTIIALNTHATTASALAAKQVQVNDAAPDSVQPSKLSNLLSLPFNWSTSHTTYWQHGDHLGSANWVTDTAGTGYQFLQYMPWGEPLVDLRSSSSSYDTRYTFSGKERDEETGYSYFGARYYNSDLSVWLSVDPMSDKYPGVSPYVYCGNNPVRLVDEDGRDWFENEKTGDVYYAQNYHKGDEHLIDGEGWKWLGKNEMFGQSADDVITANLDKADVYTQGDSYDRVGFSGNNAKEFMSNMGYKNVPTQVVTYDNTYSYSMSDGRHTTHFTLGEKYDYTEKSSYVPYNFSESNRQQIGNSVYGKLDPMTGQMPQVNRNIISYSKTPNLSRIGKLFYALRGYHDYTTHINCGKLQSSNITGAQGALIREFLNKNR